MKISQCFLSEYKGERRGEDGRMKPLVRYITGTRIKWPLYSLDGTKHRTVRVNKDPLSKNRGRKLTLKKALKESGLSQWERTQVWRTYLQVFESGVTLPPMIPPALVSATLFGEHRAISKEVVPARIIPFPEPIVDPLRLLKPSSVFMAPASDLVH